MTFSRDLTILLTKTGPKTSMKKPLSTINHRLNLSAQVNFLHDCEKVPEPSLIARLYLWEIQSPDCRPVSAALEVYMKEAVRL